MLAWRRLNWSGNNFLKLPINLILAGTSDKYTKSSNPIVLRPPPLFPFPSRQLTAMLSRQVLRSVRAAAPQRAFAVRTTPVRNYAAAAAADVQVPKAVYGVDGTYATALVR